MSAFFEELKAIPILDVARRLGLEFHGTKMNCINPYHEDKNPSFSFNIEENYFNCFSCEVHGSNIDLVILAYGCEQNEAIHWLAQEFGISGDKCPARRYRLKKKSHQFFPGVKKNRGEHKPDPEIYQWLLDRAILPVEACDYLDRRGLSKKTITEFRIGGTLDAGTLIRGAVTEFGEERVLHAGLLVQKKDSEKYRPVLWKQVLMIPFYWEQREPIYIQARRIGAKSVPKYIGLSRIAKPLFNAQLIKQLNSGSRVHIVEGAMDAMAAHQLDLSAIGVLGASTKFKLRWAQRMKEFQVIIVPHNDRAGSIFKENLISIFDEIGKTVEVMDLPSEFNDLADTLESKHL